MIFRRYATLVVVFLSFLGFACRVFAGSPPRAFDFSRDSLSYSNELVWEYGWDQRHHWTGHKRQPPPSYTLHCFVVSRTVASFFRHATFEPSAPIATSEEYRQLIRKVLRLPLRRETDTRIIIPGYANLREFSQAREEVLKQESGRAWQSYFQRGHWRMIFPFSRGHQQRTASQLEAAIEAGKVPLVHFVRFPELTINHASLLFGVNRNGKNVEFLVYDPNNVAEPVKLDYNNDTRTFSLPANTYFPGGRVDVYQIWHKLLY